MLIGVKDSQSDLEKHYKTFCGLYKIKAFRAQFRGVRDRAFSYIDLLNYMLKYKIPQIVTLTRSNLVINPLIERQGGNFFLI